MTRLGLDHLIGRRVRVFAFDGGRRLVGLPTRVVAIRRDFGRRPVAVLADATLAYASEPEIRPALQPGDQP